MSISVRNKINRSGLKFVLVTLALATGFIVAFGRLGYRVNLTPSYPLGIWRMEHRSPVKGDFVLFSFPAQNHLTMAAIERGYLRDNGHGYMPLMKKLAALPSDRIAVTDVVSINGVEWTNGQILRVDSKGREVVSIAVSEIVAPGMCWVLSDYNPRSFDSRYFGAVPLSNIIAVAHPVFVWDGDF